MGAWSIPLDRLAAKAKADIETVARKVTLDVFAAVARRSPVASGRFRANWNVSYGTPDMTTTSSTDEGRVTTEIARAGRLPVGGVVYMTNSLPYARRLEYGWSKQAPQGMVRLTVVEYQQFVERVLR